MVDLRVNREPHVNAMSETTIGLLQPIKCQTSNIMHMSNVRGSRELVRSYEAFFDAVQENCNDGPFITRPIASCYGEKCRHNATGD